MIITVAGAGAVSAAGCSPAAQWDTYVRGKTTWAWDLETGLPIYAIPRLPQVRAIKDFAAGRNTDRSSLLALHAARQAVEAAGWEGDRAFSIIVGCSRGPTLAWEDTFSSFKATGTPPLRSSPATTLGSIGFALADFFGLSGLASSLSVTCSSGFHALVHGIALLESGMAERVLVGGTEASLSPFTLRQMEVLRVYANPRISGTLRLPSTGGTGYRNGYGGGSSLLCLGAPFPDGQSPHYRIRLWARGRVRSHGHQPGGWCPTVDYARCPAALFRRSRRDRGARSRD